MDQWYYAHDGGQQGPVALAELQRLLSTGAIDGATLVWKDGMAAWTAAASVSELSPQAVDGWHYSAAGGQLGPVSLANLQQLVSTGQITADTLVWHETMPAWAAAGTRPELFSAPAMTGGPGMLNYGQVYADPNSGVYAGFWLRFAAAFIDGLILLIPNYAVQFGLNLAFSGKLLPTRPNPIASLLAFAINVCIPWLYYAYMESSEKQATLGKQAVSIKVVDLYGHRLTFGRATGRFFAKYISYFTCAVGFIMAGFTQKKQALHDMIAQTLVVRS